MTGFCVRVSSSALAVSNMVLTITRRRGSVTEHSPSLGPGPPDRAVVLEIESFRDSSARPRTVKLKRAGTDKAVSHPRPEKLYERRPGICYEDLTRMSDPNWNDTIPNIECASESLSTCVPIPRSIRTGSLI